MTVTLELNPDVEQRLNAQARQHGVSLQDYVKEIVLREAHIAIPPAPAGSASNLSDLLLNSPFAGANLDLDRIRDYPRTTELE